MTILRPYQQRIVEGVIDSWFGTANTVQNVLMVMPTGAGKTVTFPPLLTYGGVPAIAIAHRQELVGQVSMTLAREGIEHWVIAPDLVIRALVTMQVRKFGASYISRGANTLVAGVDTMIRRDLKEFRHLRRWVIDEAHHVLRGNKWGKATAMLPPEAKGLGVTATPRRCDGRGLGRHAHGVFDRMLVGPSVSDLMRDGYLCPYIIYGPEESLNRAELKVSESTHEFTQHSVMEVAKKNKPKVVGDCVKHYEKYTPGKRGITFNTDVDTAREVAAAYNSAGIPAAMVCSDTDDTVRGEISRRFERGELLQLTNVDLFGEGYDVPAVEVVTMARPSESLSLVKQQMGRMMRPAEGKAHGVVIDMVGNCLKHGAPDESVLWSLDAEDKRTRGESPGTIPLRTCKKCTAMFKAVLDACPYCKEPVTRQARGGPEQVEGDVTLLTPEALAFARGEILRIDGAPRYPMNADVATRRHIDKMHAARIEAQAKLRDLIALWAGYNRDAGYSYEEGYRSFWYKFGIDVLSAQTLGAADTAKLYTLILKDLT